MPYDESVFVPQAHDWQFHISQTKDREPSELELQGDLRWCAACGMWNCDIFCEAALHCRGHFVYESGHDTNGTRPDTSLRADGQPVRLATLEVA